MHDFEFTTKIKNGMIHIPDNFNYPADTSVRVIIIKETKAEKPTKSTERNRASNIQFGVLKGKVKISDDFDAPMPDNILSEFEGRQ